MAAVYLLLVLPLVSAQTYHWGPCPTPKIQPGFNLEKVQWDEFTRPLRGLGGADGAIL